MAAAWAGKPSWSARATIDGPMRAKAPRVGTGDRRALEERLDGDPGGDLGETRRRQRAGTADDEVGGAERGVLADEDLAGVHQRVDHGVDLVVGDGHLQVLGGVAVGDGGGRVEVVDEDAAAIGAERRPGGVGAHGRQVGELAGQFGIGRRGEVGGGRDEHHRRVGAVLGLDQQVGRQPHRIGRAVGDHQALGRPEDHHRHHAVPLQLDLGARHGGRAGADDLAHPRDRLGAERQRRQTGRAVDAEHVGDAQLPAHHQHRRVDGAAPARDRRDDERRCRGPRRRWPGRRAGRRRSGSWPCRTGRTARPRRSARPSPRRAARVRVRSSTPRLVTSAAR